MNTLSATEINAYKTQLQMLKQTLTDVDGVLEDASAVVELDQARQGRLSRMDALQAQEMSKAVLARRHQQLREIALALRRIEMDEFGYCQQCDELIKRERLDINPTIRLCIKCAD